MSVHVNCPSVGCSTVWFFAGGGHRLSYKQKDKALLTLLVCLELDVFIYREKNAAILATKFPESYTFSSLPFFFSPQFLS